ncbi:MAG TPA: hypothetical protein VJT75_09710 [Thermoleophilaceae bacterium]|nr:hypothetical protein [Thermoleophilaceae bacterium]
MDYTRRTAPVFVVYLLMIAAGIVIAIVIGIVRTSDDPAAARTVERFSAAVQRGDGATACRELSAATIDSLEQQEREDCSRAVLRLGLKGGRVSRSDVAERSAKVDVGEDGSVFLDNTRRGWLITAFACKPVEARPYDCEVED